MGEQILLIVVLTSVAAGFALLWRRLNALELDVRILRAALEQARAEGVHSAETKTALSLPIRIDSKAPAETLANAPLQEATPGPATAEPSKPPSPADDPFDAAWVKQTPSPELQAWAAPPPKPRAISAAVQPAFITHAARAIKTLPTPALPDWKRAIWAMFAASLAAPFVALSANAVAASLLFAVGAYSFALAAAFRARSPAIAWLGAGAAILWALLALSSGAASPVIAMPAAFALLGAAGLAHAAIDRDWRPGAAMTAGMLAALMALSIRFGIISPAGAAAALLVILAAATGASRARLDGLHLIGFIGAGLLLFCLSTQEQAGVWFTPGMGWTGAVFLGLAAARAPALGLQGGLVAATGCIAPLFAITGLFAAGHGLSEAWMAAAAYGGLAILITAILTISAQRAGSLAALSLTGWIFGAGAFVAATAALLLTGPIAFMSPAFAAIALSLVFVQRRSPDNLLLCAMAFATLGAVACAIVALIDFNAAVDPLTHSALALVGMLAPGCILAATARALPHQSPATRIILEIGAGACGLLALSGLVRAIFTGAAPASFPIGLAELGGHALLWAALSLGLLRYGMGGAREARVAAAGALACAAGAASLVALALWLAGAWTPAPSPATGLAAFGRHAPAGFALMACGAWLHWDHWRRRDNPLRTFTAFAAACTLTAAWISLEFSSARIIYGPGADMALLGLALLLFSATFGLIAIYYLQQTRVDMQLNFHKDLKRHG